MNLKECFLKLAEIEEYGSELYKQSSEKCSEKLRPVLLSLSLEEKQHKDTIIKLYEDDKLKVIKLENNMEKIIDYQVDYLNNEKNLGFYEEKEFFKFALQLEKNSIEIYEKILEIFAIGSYEYKIFETLIKEEKKHMIYILNKLYELN